MGCGPEELVEPTFAGGYSSWSACSFVAAESPFTESDHSGLEAVWIEFIAKVRKSSNTRTATMARPGRALHERYKVGSEYSIPLLELITFSTPP
jgi:hypothetical protein